MKGIQVNGIAKSYKAVKALQNISFEVAEGEIFGLIGPDGAGKTTLLRIMTSLMLPDTGAVNVHGLDTVKDHYQLRSEIGYMPGRFSLYQDLSVEENLDFFATVFGTTIRENYELIKPIYIQLEPFKDRPAGKLSGGMKQKLALCCALIHCPKTLFLDEPTTGVDPVSRKEFWEMLKDLKKYNITIVVSTPYMDEAMLCDRVALMEDGQILEIEKPEVIIGQFRRKLWAVRAENMHRLVQDLRAYPFVHSAYIFGEYIHYTDAKQQQDTSELQQYLQVKGHQRLEIIPAQVTIEDCFMELMSKNVAA
jgi:ABC-2 type transport system ATP-binding protein